jgi:hypothetical protein
MLANPKDIHAHLIGDMHAFEQFAEGVAAGLW